MLKTKEFLDLLPPYETDEILPEPWPELCKKANRIAHEDIDELFKKAQATLSLGLLPNVQFDLNWFLKPSHMLGSVIIVPGDSYLEKTRQKTLEQIHREHPLGRVSLGLELEFEMFRPMVTHRIGTDMLIDYGIVLALEFYAGFEYEAFREIYRNYRGIVGKLLELGNIEFFLNGGISEVERVRGKNPLAKLDALFGVKNVDPDNSTFYLQYKWHHRRTYEEGMRAFRSLAILFTCIQKASASPKSRKDHILNYWNSIKKV
jgi:hypothetical protein